MTDGQSSASVVIVDAKQAALERDRLARAQLAEGSAPVVSQLLSLTGVQHTVPYSLQVVVPQGSDKDAVRKTVEAILHESFRIVHDHLNHFNPNSEVSELNQMPAGMTHTMSPHLAKVLFCCVEVYSMSAGVFDPAVAPVTKFLKDRLAAGKSLAGSTFTAEEAATFQRLRSISTLPAAFRMSRDDKSITKRANDAALDLGGLNKGYGVDLVVEGCVAKGIKNVLFDWGGDCRANGENLKGEPWAVGVVRPPSLDEIVKGTWKRENASLLRVVRLENEALTTSGDYENLRKGPKGELYTTLFQSREGQLLQPTLQNIAQVSVKCYSAMYGDALTTASLLKHSLPKVRHMLDNWRYAPHAVTDYTAYVRKDELVGRMFEVSKDSPSIKARRLGDCLPARVVVVGGGLAGLSAAIAAADCGATVVLLEKTNRVGGNSAKATSGINGWGTRPQAEQSVSDGGKYFERDTHLSGVGGQCDPALVKMLSVKSGEAIRWLSSYGIPLTVLSQLGGHSRKRCHRAPDKSDGTPVPIGYTIMQQLEQYIRTQRSRDIKILTDTTVSSLIHDSETLPDGTFRIRVSGVRYTTKGSNEVVEFLADGVVLATGGFSNDQSADSLMRQHAPHLFGRPTTNGPFATGDGVKMARAIGAQLVDMDKVQLHPTGFIDPKDPANNTKYLGPEALRGSGGVLLNQRGERFVNELDLRSVVSKAIQSQKLEYPGSNGSLVAYCVLNEEAATLFGRSSLSFYWKRLGLFTQVPNVAELAKLIRCDEATVLRTLTTYQGLSSSKKPCPATGKNVYPCVLGPQGPFYVAIITPSIHYTMGGALISPAAEIQSGYITTSVFGHRRPIQGLFGAGEVTGGVHGQNRLGGNSLLECVVYGRIAGDRAATVLQRKPNALSLDSWTTVVLREIREGDAFGLGSRILRFNLPGAKQSSGLKLGQFISIRGEWDGRHLVGYYSPITLPDDQGVIGILVRVDKGTLRDWLLALKPGDAVEMRGCGGLIIDRFPEKKQLFIEGRPIRKLGLIAGGSGVAPMVQIMRAALKKPYVENIDSIDLIYAVEDVRELTYRRVLEDYQRDHKHKLRTHYILNNPPAGWTGGVGFVDRNVLSQSLPQPSKDLLIVICGPPVMQRVIKATLVLLGHDDHMVRTVDEAPQPAPSKL